MAHERVPMHGGDWMFRGTMRRTAMLLALLCLGLAGCRSTSYRLGGTDQYFLSPNLTESSSPNIERGTPRPVLDAVGWVVGIPDKIILWDRRIANHRVSSATEESLAEYLALNELNAVKVRVNQYAPLADWRRLRDNSAVGAGWRYSLGTLSWLGEMVFPGRVFGGDHFNPFTNTIHLYSDAPAIALHEAGHAKDFAGRYWKGTYAAVYLLPGVPLWHEAIATNDALSYLHARGETDAEAEAYQLLYPAYGTYAGDAASYLVPANGSLPVYVGGVLTGHAVGRLRAHRVRRAAATVDSN